MKRHVLGLVFVTMVLARVAGLSAAEWGNLSGTFLYDGQASKPAPLSITKDIECCGQFQNEIVDQSLLVGSSGGLSNVFIYLKQAPDKKAPIHPDYEKEASAKPAVLDNLHCMLYPHGLGVWATKQTLHIKNSDPIGHAAKIDFFKNPPINALIPVGGSLDQKYQVAEAVPTVVLCGVHPWESAYLLVHDSPYFAITDKDGKFTLANLPVGEWQFTVWHEKCGYVNAMPAWKRGVFTMAIKAGDNDLGTIKVPNTVFKKK